MTSRSFRITINVDRPDPENRPFVHPDPLAWTAQNRQKILRCLYTILIYGCQNRPAGQVQKTRFKDWWSLCGWPVELAASLINQGIDCTALMKAGDIRDDEAARPAPCCRHCRLSSVTRPSPRGNHGNSRRRCRIVRYGYRQEGKCRPTIRRVRSDARAPARSADRRDNRQNSQQPPRRPADLRRQLRCCRRPEGILEKHTSRYRVQALPGDGPNYTTAGPATTETMSPISPISLPTAHSRAMGGDGGHGGDNSSQSAPLERVIPGAGASACPPEHGSEMEGEL